MIKQNSLLLLRTIFPLGAVKNSARGKVAGCVFLCAISNG